MHTIAKNLEYLNKTGKKKHFYDAILYNNFLKDMFPSSQKN
jgi:hypothetical protein